MKSANKVDVSKKKFGTQILTRAKKNQMSKPSQQLQHFKS